MTELVFQPINTWPETLQPRERLLNDGAGALNDGELLAILLRTGTRNLTVLDLARQILNKFNGLSGIATLHAKEWAQISGIGPTKAATVIAALELGRRTWTAQSKKEPLSTPDATYNYVAPRFLGETRETLWILGLDAKNGVVADSVVSTGTTNRTAAYPREIFAPLLRCNAVKGILVHNHPSGDPAPSQEDIQLTDKMVVVGQSLDLPIVDHIIVGDDQYTSLRELGVCACP